MSRESLPALYRIMDAVPHAAEAPLETGFSKFFSDYYRNLKSRSAENWSSAQGENGGGVPSYLLSMAKSHPELAAMLGGGALGGAMGGGNWLKWMLGLGGLGLLGGAAWKNRDDLAKGVGSWLGKVIQPLMEPYMKEMRDFKSWAEQRQKEGVDLHVRPHLNELFSSGAKPATPAAPGAPGSPGTPGGGWAATAATAMRHPMQMLPGKQPYSAPATLPKR